MMRNFRCLLLALLVLGSTSLAGVQVPGCTIHSCIAYTSCGKSCMGHSCFGLQCETYFYNLRAVCRGFNADGTVGSESFAICE